MRRLFALAALLFSAALVIAAPGDVHLALGNPSNAKADPKDPDHKNYLIVKDQFALSYNDKKGIPNWVSYKFRRNDCGRAPRGDFHPDPSLPKSFHQVLPFDYHFNQTGWTRGHMCPSSHRNNTEVGSQSTFVMTNMVPQTEELNAGAWNELENYCRDLVFQNHELWVVCGPLGEGGKTHRGYYKFIDGGRISVPEFCWKVVLVVDASGFNVAGKLRNKSTRLIGVIMPNDRTPEKAAWSDYLVKVSDIEEKTGFKFFDKLPDEAIMPLKNRIDRGR